MVVIYHLTLFRCVTESQGCLMEPSTFRGLSALPLFFPNLLVTTAPCHDAGCRRDEGRRYDTNVLFG